MQIALSSMRRKIAFLSLCLALSVIYLSFCAREFLAFYFSEKPDLASLQQAAALEPKNATYQDLLGRFYLLTQREPQSAAQFFRSATNLNPHQARYWFDLSTAYQLLGDRGQQKSALLHATVADPRTPEVAWEAANFDWADGDANEALGKFKVVIESDPSLSGQALESCWRIRPDVNALMQEALPRNAEVYSSFLEFLISRNRAEDAASVWRQLVQLRQSVERRYVFEYVQYLTNRRDVDQARVVWQQAAELSGLSAYQPSPENLIVNGDFSLPILNAGFDWLYEQEPGVSLSLDPTVALSGSQSLEINLDGNKISDLGIRQLVPVESNAHYEFTAYFRAQELRGAGGPLLTLEDAYTTIPYFTSEELKDADYWKLIRGEFSTGPGMRLLVLRLQHSPAEAAIRGQLWLDGFRLAKIPSPEAGE